MSLRLLVVSHPAVVAANQLRYVALLDRGVDVQLVVPHLWQHELGDQPVPPEVHSRLDGRVHRARIARPGSIQRHVHLTPPGRWLRRFRPDAVLVEEEHFSVPAAQWVASARLRRIPVAVQAYENLDRPLPWPARVLRWYTLRGADGVHAGTPAAGDRARQWGARGVVHLVPAPIDASRPPVPPARDGHPLTVGYAGRLIESKGLLDLVAAVEAVEGARLLAIGRGELAADLARHPAVELRDAVPHDDMPAVYAEMDVLVLPSRTTPTWAEQLGRVLLEAMVAGRPVIGSQSGEIPWVLEVARGGATFPEGDVAALAALLTGVRDDPDTWLQHAEQGRRDVLERFSPDASATAFLALVDAMLSRRRAG